MLKIYERDEKEIKELGRKKISFWVLLIGLICSVGINIIQLVEIRDHISQREFYDSKFASDFHGIQFFPNRTYFFIEHTSFPLKESGQ